MDNKRFNIYIHINKSNGKTYVGQTCQKPERRWGVSGTNYLKQNNSHHIHYLFAPAISKYGWDGFYHKILFTGLTKLEADMIEEDLIYYYKKNNKSYNVLLKAGNTILSEESRKKISNALKGRNTWIKGRTFSDSEKHKRAVAHYKEVEQWDDNGYISSFPSIKDAAISLNICGSSIVEAAKGKRKTAGGFIWKYKG